MIKISNENRQFYNVFDILNYNVNTAQLDNVLELSLNNFPNILEMLKNWKS